MRLVFQNCLRSLLECCRREEKDDEAVVVSTTVAIWFHCLLLLSL